MNIAILRDENTLPPDLHFRREADVGEPKYDNLFEEELAKLTAAFRSRGMTLQPVLWREALDRAEEFDAVLPLTVWDYFEENEEEFLAQMVRVNAVTPVMNPPDILRWNADKSYLDELAKRGAPVIPTLFVDGVTLEDAKEAFERFGGDRIVIKPTVGGGAWRQVLYRKGEAWPQAHELPPKGAMIQPFLASVQDEGEYSLLYFGGQFSHALVKRPSADDYRIQARFGGVDSPVAASREALAVAKRVLDQMDSVPLYCRIDLLRGIDRKLALIELELIEPYLYLPMARTDGDLNSGALMFATELKKRISSLR